MILYHISDDSGDCGNGYFFASKKEAFGCARELSEDRFDDDTPIDVYRYDIGKIDQKKIIRMLEGHGFAQKITLVGSFQGKKKEDQ